MDLQVNDIAELKKEHPCGSKRWQVLRVGMDIKLREIFAVAGEIPGVRGAEVYPNCVARENRYDVMIVLEMDRDALSLYDDSEMHHRWKDEFGGLLEKKAIFDYE